MVDATNHQNGDSGESSPTHLDEERRRRRNPGRTGRKSAAKIVAHHDPLEVIERARSVYGVRRVICYTSCGKDSIATLSLCRRHFDTVFPVFMYLVPGLSFQETYLQYIERLFSVSILRIPHWMLAGLFRGASLRHPTKQSKSVRPVKIKDVDAYVRKQFGVHWIASGERAQESVERNAMLRQCQGVSVKRGRLFPLTYWNESQAFGYLRANKIALPADYGAGLNFSFGSLWERELRPIRDRFPDDWKKILKIFPLAESQLLRYDERMKHNKENV